MYNIINNYSAVGILFEHQNITVQNYVHGNIVKIKIATIINLTIKLGT